MSRSKALEPPRPHDKPAFSRRTLLWLAVAGGLSLLATLLLPLLTSDGAPARTRGPNAYSYSPVGHHALVSVLRDLGIPVLVSRHRSASKVDSARPLVIAEPHHYEPDELMELIVEALGRDAAVVLVLPKWDPHDWDPPARAEDEIGPTPTSTPRTPGLLPPEDVVAPLEIAWRAAARALGRPARADVFSAADVVRLTPAPSWSWLGELDDSDGQPRPPPAPTLPRFQGLGGNIFNEGVAVVGPFAAPTLESLALIFVHVEADLWVITDPELINTLGLGLGDNAVLAYRFLVDHLGATGLVFDEVVHGFKKPPSIWAELTDFPLLVVTLHLVGLLLLALWTASGRFGKPDAEPPRVAPGKATLISNTATLLALGGHCGYSLRDYFRASLRAVARTLSLPPSLDDDERLASLARLARDRGVDVDLDDLARRVAAISDTKRDARRAVTTARRIHRFRLEMTDGQPLDPRPRRA